MPALAKSLLKHEGVQALAFAILMAFTVTHAIPEPFFQLNPQQKKEYLKTRYRRARRKAEELFDLDDDENECN